MKVGMSKMRIKNPIIAIFTEIDCDNFFENSWIVCIVFCFYIKYFEIQSKRLKKLLVL